MNKTAVLLVVLTAAGIAQGWYTNHGNGRFSGTRNAEVTLTQIDSITFEWRTTNPSSPDYRWGYTSTDEWDQYPEPWGLETHSFVWVGQNADYGRGSLLLSTGDTPEIGEIIYHFKIPSLGVTSLVWDASSRWLTFSARANDSEPWTPIWSTSQAVIRYQNEIPLGLLDTSVPGQTTFQVQVLANNNPGVWTGYSAITATRYEDYGTLDGAGGNLAVLTQQGPDPQHYQFHQAGYTWTDVATPGDWANHVWSYANVIQTDFVGNGYLLMPYDQPNSSAVVYHVTIPTPYGLEQVEFSGTGREGVQVDVRPHGRLDDFEWTTLAQFDNPTWETKSDITIDAGQLETASVPGQTSFELRWYNQQGQSDAAISDLQIDATVGAEPTLSGISITSGPDNVAQNTTAHYTAAATYTNGSTMTTTVDITDAATWGLANPSLGSIEKGAYQAPAVGSNTALTITVSYTDDSITELANQPITVVTTSPAVTTLYTAPFDSGNVAGWRTYDSTLEMHDPLTTDTMTYQGSPRAVISESNASSMHLIQLAQNLSLSFPIEPGVCLSFAYYCQAGGPDNDQISVVFEGHGPAPESEAFVAGTPISFNPTLNAWNTVSVPLYLCGEDNYDGAVDYRIHVNWYRGGHDAHTLFVDDFKVTRGSNVSPALLEANSFQVSPSGITVQNVGGQDQYAQTLHITAELTCHSWWMVRIVDGPIVVRSYVGGGSDVEVVWDGKDEAGDLVQPGELTVSLDVDAGFDAVAAVTEQTTVDVAGGVYSNMLTGPGAVLVADSQIDYSGRAEQDNVLTVEQLPSFSPLANQLFLTIEQGHTAVLPIRLVGLAGSWGDVSVSASNLVDGTSIISANNIALRPVEQEVVSLGYVSRRALSEEELFTADPMVEIDVAVSVPSSMPVGFYQGTLNVAGESVPLKVTVVASGPAVRWWQGQKWRIMLCKLVDHVSNDQAYIDFANAGFNVTIPYVGVNDHLICGQYAAQHDLRIIARTPVPCAADNYQQWTGPWHVWPDGSQASLPCPYDAQFWTDVMIPPATTFANMALSVPLVGMEWDFEVYGGSNYAHIYTHCFDDTCWQAYDDYASHEVPDAGSISTGQRNYWLRQNGYRGEYKVFQDGRLRIQVRRMRDAVDAIAPDLSFMLLPWHAGHFLEILADELGTATAPVLLATERTYGRGPDLAETDIALERHKGTCLGGLIESKHLGFDSEYVPGVMPDYQEADPIFCRENAVTLSSYADGYWVFFQRFGSYSLAEYLLRFQQANELIYQQPQCLSSADLDHTGQVNWDDLGIFAGQWLWTGPAGPPAENIADLDCSGSVNLDDFSTFGAQWLQTAP